MRRSKTRAGRRTIPLLPALQPTLSDWLAHLHTHALDQPTTPLLCTRRASPLTHSFSWRLVLAPPEALETVVVHELAHLRVFGHGHKFWDLVAGRRPDHRAWRRWLHDHSTELHSAVGRGDRAGVVSAEPEAARLGEPDEAIA